MKTAPKRPENKPQIDINLNLSKHAKVDLEKKAVKRKALLQLRIVLGVASVLINPIVQFPN